MNQRGMSLVETLIALGMMGMVAAVLVTIQATSQQSVVKIEEFSNVTAVILHIQKTITDNNLYMPPVPGARDLAHPSAVTECYSDKGELVTGVQDIQDDKCWYLVKYLKTEVRDSTFANTDHPLSDLPISQFLFSIQYYRGNRGELALPEAQREGQMEVLAFTRLKTGHITE